jgi:hypothetical protein
MGRIVQRRTQSAKVATSTTSIKWLGKASDAWWNMTGLRDEIIAITARGGVDALRSRLPNRARRPDMLAA